MHRHGTAMRLFIFILRCKTHNPKKILNPKKTLKTPKPKKI
jgi:hypothetical protein